MTKEGLQSISHPMYLATTYPQVPIMLNVGAPPSQVVNGASPPSVSASPGIFANYLHSVPPQFSSNAPPSAANPNAFTNNAPVVNHASTSTPQGTATGATGGIAPASAATAASGSGPSNPNKQSTVGPRKRLTTNGASQNVAAGQPGSSTPISKQARSEAAKQARQQQQQSQQQQIAPGTELARAGRGGTGTSSRLRGIALNPNQSPQPTLIDTTLDASRQLPIYRPNATPTVAIGVEVGEEDDDDEMDADADADGDGDEEGMNATAASMAGVGTGVPGSTKVVNAMGMDGLTT